MFSIYWYGSVIGVLNIVLGISCHVYYCSINARQVESTGASPRSFWLLGNPSRDLKAKFFPVVLLLSGITAFFFGGMLDPFVALQQVLNNIIIVSLILIDFKDNLTRR